MDDSMVNCFDRRQATKILLALLSFPLLPGCPEKKDEDPILDPIDNHEPAFMQLTLLGGNKLYDLNASSILVKTL